MSVIAQIRQERLRVTQVHLARICGVAQATVSRWEAGQDEPRLSHMQAMLDYARKHRHRLSPGHFFVNGGPS